MQAVPILKDVWFITVLSRSSTKLIKQKDIIQKSISWIIFYHFLLPYYYSQFSDVCEHDYGTIAFTKILRL